MFERSSLLSCVSFVGKLAVTMQSCRTPESSHSSALQVLQLNKRTLSKLYVHTAGFVESCVLHAMLCMTLCMFPTDKTILWEFGWHSQYWTQIQGPNFTRNSSFPLHFRLLGLDLCQNFVQLFKFFKLRSSKKKKKNSKTEGKIMNVPCLKWLYIIIYACSFLPQHKKYIYVISVIYLIFLARKSDLNFRGVITRYRRDVAAFCCGVQCYGSWSTSICQPSCIRRNVCKRDVTLQQTRKRNSRCNCQQSPPNSCRTRTAVRTRQWPANWNRQFRVQRVQLCHYGVRICGAVTYGDSNRSWWDGEIQIDQIRLLLMSSWVIQCTAN